MPLRRRGVGRLLPHRNERPAAGIDRRRPSEGEGDDLANANRERTVLGDLGSAILRRGYQDGADGFPRDRCETQGNLTVAVAVRSYTKGKLKPGDFSARQCRCRRGLARSGRILKRASEPY